MCCNKYCQYLPLYVLKNFRYTMYTHKRRATAVIMCITATNIQFEVILKHNLIIITDSLK